MVPLLVLLELVSPLQLTAQLLRVEFQEKPLLQLQDVELAFVPGLLAAEVQLMEQLSEVEFHIKLVLQTHTLEFMFEPLEPAMFAQFTQQAVEAEFQAYPAMQAQEVALALTLLLLMAPVQFK